MTSKTIYIETADGWEAISREDGRSLGFVRHDPEMHATYQVKRHQDQYWHGCHANRGDASRWLEANRRNRIRFED